jgi:nitrogen fixation/metabolism regulation signal transduction histidine kinase
VEINSLLQRVAKLETRLRVRLIEGEECVIQADADQLQQALINLVRNATEAALGPDAENAATASVSIAWRRVDDEVTISILDNGPGLSNASNLFVPFYTTKPTGTGIGLVLAQQIAEGHAGAVRLANRTDGVTGCIAEVRLPAGTAERSQFSPMAANASNRF